MFTANTMALCFEALGISPPHSACHSAVDRENNVTIGFFFFFFLFSVSILT